MYFPMLVFFVLSGFGEYNKIMRDFFHLIQQPLQEFYTSTISLYLVTIEKWTGRNRKWYQRCSKDSLRPDQSLTNPTEQNLAKPVTRR